MLPNKLSISVWRARALSRATVDGFVLRSQDVDLRIVGHGACRRWPRSTTSPQSGIKIFYCLYLYHKPPDSGERQLKSMPAFVKRNREQLFPVPPTLEILNQEIPKSGLQKQFESSEILDQEFSTQNRDQKTAPSTGALFTENSRESASTMNATSSRHHKPCRGTSLTRKHKGPN